MQITSHFWEKYKKENFLKTNSFAYSDAMNSRMFSFFFQKVFLLQESVSFDTETPKEVFR